MSSLQLGQPASTTSQDGGRIDSERSPGLPASGRHPARWSIRWVNRAMMSPK